MIADINLGLPHALPHALTYIHNIYAHMHPHTCILTYTHNTYTHMQAHTQLDKEAGHYDTCLQRQVDLGESEPVWSTQQVSRQPGYIERPFLPPKKEEKNEGRKRKQQRLFLGRAKHGES